MARRKRILDDGDDSDSSGGSEIDLRDYGAEDDGPDDRDERALFEDPYKRKKRRRTNGKDSAIYGVFGEDSADEGLGERARDKRQERRSDWTKAPAFVISDKKVDLKESTPDQMPSADVSADDDVDGETSEDSSESRPPSPRVRVADEEELVETPRLGGIGSNRARSVEPPDSFLSSDGIRATRRGIGSKGGIGSASRSPSSGNSMNFTKGGIGTSSMGPSASSSFLFSTGGVNSREAEIESPSATADAADDSQTRQDTPMQVSVDSLPTSFGLSRPQRSFLRDGSGRATPPTAVPTLSTQERLHFNRLQESFGAKLLSKMGWQAGTGLGVEGAGIVTPIESKLRPKGAGIAFGGFKEKTEQSKAEARRRGEVISDDEDEKEKKRRGKVRVKGAGDVHVEREERWKKPKKSKLKIEHKTYEEIIAGAGEAKEPGIGKIIDATGAILREVSLADISVASWTPSTDPMRIPEVRHNLRLITDACKIDLDGMTKEAKALEERKKWVASEDPRLRRKVEDEAELIQRLQAVHLVVDDISAKSKDVGRSDYEPSLDIFSAPFSHLLVDYSTEYDKYRLDEVVVAAIAPTFRRIMATWRPLEVPTLYTDTLRQWRTALKMTAKEESQSQVDVYGSSVVSSRVEHAELPMTPYESLLWNVWLARVRLAINNDWSPSEPLPAVRLYEAWSDILPTFIRDNMLDQLILPKVAEAISNWTPKKKSVSLQAIVFPWLPHVGLRMEQFVDDARRKVKSLLRSWMTSDGVPKELMPWKEVFNPGDWDAMLLKYVVPKLGATLREDFRVNPRNQNMDPLNQVMQWSNILRTSIIGQLLEAEFFPKWLDVLHVWLVQPTVNFEEVAQWYSFWKGSFPENIQRIPAVEHGFTRGLQMMNQALELDVDAPTKLPKPDHNHRYDRTAATANRDLPTPRAKPSRMHEITFRSIVEDYVSSHNLLFMPAGKVHEKSRLPLFRISKTVDGKGGVLVYLLDDAAWASDPGGEEYRAITLESIVLRATKGQG